MLRALQPADPRLIGPYRLVGLLGSGGMGRVFLGISAGGRPVAVKIIRAELAADPDFRSRFSREVTAARRVSGLFTALVVDADVDAPMPWLATAFVPGLSLAQTVKDHGPLSAKSVVSLAAGLAEGLIAIHAAGVVHGDLKPSNVLLAEDGPRVIDFGISRAAGTAPLTHPGLVLGSPGYMSPEQAMGKPTGPLSDVFSLGAVLAYASTGRKPFGTGASVVLLDRVINGSPDLDHVPPEVRSLAERCLAKDPADRPTPDDVLAEVGAGQSTDWLPESIVRMIPKEIPATRVGDPLAVVGLGGQPTITLGSLPSDAVFTPSPPAAAGEPRSDQRTSPPVPASPVPASPVPASADPPSASSPRPDQSPASPPPADRQADPPASSPPDSPPRADDQVQPGEQAEPVKPLARSQAGGGGESRHRVWRSLAALCVGGGVLTASGAAGFAVGVALRHPASPARAAAKATSSPSVDITPAAQGTSRPAVSGLPSITRTSTYTKGPMVYLDIRYADPGHHARGFGFVGVKGSSWAEQNHLFTSPAKGIIKTSSVAYPFNQECGTAQQWSSYVKVWIYGAAGVRSQPVTVHLVCSG